MVKPFSPPVDLSFGTAVSDSYRIAPEFPTVGTLIQNGLVITEAAYDQYGPGMLTTPFSTWNITPYPKTDNNIVAPTAVTAEGWLTLTGDNGATTLVASNNPQIFPPGAPNNFYVQFDWPRVPQVVLLGAVPLPGPLNVTLFGFDWYNSPLQHTYTIQALAATYPGYITNAANMKGKAFYRITGVYINGALPAGDTLACEVSNMFGLPYVLKSYSDISMFRCDNSDMLTQGGVAQLGAGGNRVVLTPVVKAIEDARAVTLNVGNAFQGYGPQVSLTTLEAGGTPGFLRIGNITATTQVATGTFEIVSSDAADTSKVSWSIPNGGKYITAPADFNVPDNFTGDVRGLVELPQFDNYGKIPDGNTQVLFTYYVEGFDQWLKILNAGGQPQQNGVPVAGSNPIVPPNLIQDMYGMSQHYTGIPAT